MPEALFNIAMYLLHETKDKRPAGVSLLYLFLVFIDVFLIVLVIKKAKFEIKSIFLNLLILAPFYILYQSKPAI